MTHVLRLSLATALAVAGFSSVSFSSTAAAPTPVEIAQNDAAKCVNGYRTTHVIKGPGRVSGGVILRCNG